MGRWTDIAQWRGPSPNINKGGMRRWDGVVVHIAAGYYEGTISWQKNPNADVSSHFVVSRAGKIAQMVDTADAAWTQRDGNGEWLSIENEGFLPQPLTDAQVTANAKILAKAYQIYGVPLVVTNTPRSRGLGHHSMGPENGINWGHSQCPGPAIKAQKAEIVRRAKLIVSGGGDMCMELTDKIPTIRDKNVSYAKDEYTLKDWYSSAHYYILALRNALLEDNAGLRAQLTALTATMETLVKVIQAGGGDVDVVALMSHIDAKIDEAKRDARDAVADLGEGGAEQVRAEQD